MQYSGRENITVAKAVKTFLILKLPIDGQYKVVEDTLFRIVALN